MNFLNRWIELVTGEANYLKKKDIYHNDWEGLDLMLIDARVRMIIETFTFGKSLLSIDELEYLDEKFYNEMPLTNMVRLYKNLMSEPHMVKPVVGVFHPVTNKIYVAIKDGEDLKLKYVIIPTEQAFDSITIESLNRNFSTVVDNIEEMPITFGFGANTSIREDVLWVVDKVNISHNQICNSEFGRQIGSVGIFDDRIIISFKRVIKYYDNLNGLISFKRNDQKKLTEVLCMSEVRKSSGREFKDFLNQCT